MSTQKPTRAAVWELKHPQTSRGVPSQLYTDDDPVTTIKGLGYRDEAAAKLTLLLVEQPGARYKAYWTVRALSERARNHPAQTKGMRDAIEIFERWMEDSLGMDGICHRKFVDEERDQRRLLVASHANAHARSRCSSEGQFAQFAADDRADAVCRLRAAATHGANEFDLAATSFVAAFGGPGEHGYGWHACDAAATAGLARFRCTCSFRGTHTVTVTGGPRNRRPLGAAATSSSCSTTAPPQGRGSSRNGRPASYQSPTSSAPLPARSGSIPPARASRRPAGRGIGGPRMAGAVCSGR